MKRRLIPGAMDRHGVAHPYLACTGGGCNQGRTPARCDCPLGNTELANTHSHLQLVVSHPTRPLKRLPPPRVQVQHYPTPRRRLVKRFFRDLVAFLLNRKIDLS